MSHIVKNLYEIKRIMDVFRGWNYDVTKELFATLDNVINEREKAEELRIAMNTTDKDVYYAGEDE